MNVQLNIANTDVQSFARWMRRNDPRIPFTAMPAMSNWHRRTERGIVAQVWNLSAIQVDRLLQDYGRDHPAEEAFGLLILPDSQMVPNGSCRSTISQQPGVA